MTTNTSHQADANNPAEILPQLTPAMRDAITRDEDSHGNIHADNPATVRALVQRGLARRCGGVWFKRTDLGRAVRDAVRDAVPNTYDRSDLAMILGDLRFEPDMWAHSSYPDVQVLINGERVPVEGYYYYDKTDNVICIVATSSR